VRAAGAAALLLLLLGSSCAQVVSSTRRERGPLLRSFERQYAKETAGYRAELRAQWPSLELSLVSSSVCHTEAVREYAEEVITERSSPGAAPSIATGATMAVVGAALLLFRGAISDVPDTSYIDSGGRYGPSPRRIATVWAIPLLVIGVPSAAAGAVGLFQVGETTTKGTVDQVSDVRESRCDEQPANGTLAVMGPNGKIDARATQEGKVVLPLEVLKGTVVGLELDGQPVSVDPEDAEVLEAFRACGRLLPLPDDAALGNASALVLRFRLEEAQRCARIPGAGGGEAATRLTALLEARVPPPYQTMEEAVGGLAPSLTFAPGSADLAKLARRESLEGATARVQGTVLNLASPTLALLEVGAGNVVFLEVDSEGRWPGKPPRPGAVLDAVGVMVGWRTAGDVEAPLLRVAFARATR
jgi:hypothetical protein